MLFLVLFLWIVRGLNQKERQFFAVHWEMLRRFVIITLLITEKVAKMTENSEIQMINNVMNSNPNDHKFAFSVSSILMALDYKQDKNACRKTYFDTCSFILTRDCSRTNCLIFSKLNWVVKIFQLRSVALTISDSFFDLRRCERIFLFIYSKRSYLNMHLLVGRCRSWRERYTWKANPKTITNDRTTDEDVGTIDKRAKMLSLVNMIS